MDVILLPFVALIQISMSFLILFLYFVPSFVAFLRNHHNRWAILLLNVFLGFTMIGWVIALIWSATMVKSR